MNDPREPGRTGAAEHPALLPWYVDGSLDPVSAREVEIHLRECAECRLDADALASMRDSLRAAHPGPDRPIPLEELLAYESEDRSLAPARRESIEEHIAACATCREDLAALRESRKAGDAGRRRDAPPAIRPERAGGQRTAWISAAALLLLGAGLALVWLTWPSPGEAITFLPAQRGSESTPVLRGGGPWKLTVVLPFDAPAGMYRVLVEGQDGVGVGGSGSLIASGSEGSLFVPLASLPRPGRYRIVVSSGTGAVGDPYVYAFEYTAEAESKP